MSAQSLNLTQIVREAILNNKVYDYAIKEIQSKTGASRTQAKALQYAFIYRATEPTLQKVLVQTDEELQKKYWEQKVK